MSAIDTLRQIQARANALHQQYEQMEKAKDALDELFRGESVNTRADIRAVIQQAQALKPQIEALVRSTAQAQEQSSAAVAAANNEISAIESDNDDKLSDIEAYATDWPGEIDELIAEMNEYMADPDNFADDKSVRALKTKSVDRRRLREIEGYLDDDPSEDDLRGFEAEVEEYIAQPADPGKWPEVAEVLLQRIQGMLRAVRRGDWDATARADRRPMDMKQAPGAHALYR